MITFPIVPVVVTATPAPAAPAPAAPAPAAPAPAAPAAAAPAASGAPAPPVPSPPVRRAPSSLAVPSVDDASAAASAALHQTASYVGLLTEALDRSADEYTRVVKNGFLDDAISYAQYAHALIDYDKNVDNDGFAGMVEGAVMAALKGVRAHREPIADPANLRAELTMAGAAATNAASAMALLASGARR